ncbi:MAG TPA: hypothetical protein EYP58_06135 [bacterium (Candidatus Stahlbacteria)]|nr:hypothetical protein [Candidatus Stahlbacteria bacterium]
MFNPKRLIIATIFGLIFGFVCLALASCEGPQPWFMALSIIISRTLIGFAIGISLLTLPWWLHGIVIGGLFSLPGGLSSLYIPEKGMFIMVSSIIMGIIYGFMIELFTTVVFKAGRF